MSSITLAFLNELRPYLIALIQEAVGPVIREDAGPHYPEKVNVQQAAEITGYSVNSLYQMKSKGTIPGVVKVGSKLLFDTATLRKWVENGGSAV